MVGMRIPGVAIPAILLLAGTLYFFARGVENAGGSADGSRFGQSAAPQAEDFGADENDRVLIRTLLESTDLSEDQAASLVGAAGRRYMRRKLAYAAARQAVYAGTAAAPGAPPGAPGGLDSIRRDMEVARKVCDLAESLGRRTGESAVTARADWEMERRLAYIPSTMVGLVERYDGGSTFTDVDLGAMEQAFLKHFGKPLPVSTRGDSAVHRAMGFDHRGRFDVAVSPSQPEGVWARRYLTEKHVTFYAFRGAVPGRATGAHIHIGPPSSHRVPKG
jgi:hypothetical protein